MLTNRLDKECFLRADQRAQVSDRAGRGAESAIGRRGPTGLLTEQIENKEATGSRLRSRAKGIFEKGAILMSMAVGGAGGPKSDINMTPMIDVLLVLIIIFMVITPLTPKGLEAWCRSRLRRERRRRTTSARW
jgi:hypothetical protein